MTRLVLSMLLVVNLAAASALYAQERADSGAFVVQLGSDTLVLERFVRFGNKVRAEALTLSPATALRHYELETDAQNRLIRYTWQEKPLPGRRLARSTHETLLFEADTAIITTITDSMVVRRIAVPRDVVPFLNLIHWPYDVLTRRAVASGEDSIALPFLGGRSATRFMFTRVGRDSLLIRNPTRGTMRAHIDSEGRLLGLDGSATTLKLKVTRVPWLELDRFAAAFAARAGERPRELSPRGETRASVHGASFVVDYGRPLRRGREIFGRVVPFGQVWRTGANRATHLTTDHALAIGAVTLPAGTYTLFTIPGPATWTLIISRQTGQNGTQYDAAQDFARVEMKTRALDDVVEQFTIAVEPADKVAELRFSWDRTQAYLPFRVMRAP